MADISRIAQLNEKQENFCKYFVECKNASAAYLKAFPNSANWKKNSLYCEASKLLKRQRIQQRISELNEIKKIAYEKSIKLNKKKLLTEAIQLFENLKNNPAQNANAINLLKMLFQKENLLNDSASVQVNINNAPIVNEITNYLDI